MIELLVKVAFGLAIAFLAVYYSIRYISNKHSQLEEDETPSQGYTKQETENAKLAEELYNRDLRPIVAKKAPKKEKVIEQVETIAEVVTPVVMEKAKETKPEFPIDKPKKKRKYYPKKKK